MITAIVLCAGASERMGRPKALLPLGEAPFLAVILEKCRAADLQEPIVVVGPDLDNRLSDIDLGDARVVRNPRPASGPIGSIRLALGELNQMVEAVLVWHVDRPHVRVDTARRLLERLTAGPEPIVVPAYGGRRGHPVVFGRAVFGELEAVPDNEGARAVVRAAPSRVALVDVDDPAVVEDINTPEDYEDLLERGGAG
jgi:CTP:molybdopterin cytidylyltransferase MocA